MRIRLATLIIFILNSLIISSGATELGGIKILQSSDNFIKNDDNEKRNRKYDENVKIYLNNSFNLGYKKIENENNWNDFSIPNPDYFFDKYFIYEKNNQIIKIYSLRTLERNIPQKEFKVGECESLRDQLISEKIDLLNNVNEKDQQYTRVGNNNKIIFKDRKIFKYRKNNNDIIHYFTCNYLIDYSDNEGEHLITNRIFEAIFLYDEFRKEENISNYKQVEQFNSNYIKNFKIWGNFDDRDYYTNEIFSLKKYRSSSFEKHQKLKELKDAKIKEKIKKEKEKKLVKETTDKLKINNNITQVQVKNIENSGLTLSEEDAFKAQIFGCWSIPLGLPYNENLIVRLKLKLEPDGTVVGIEILDHDRMNKPGQKAYKLLAESALRAVRLCQPLRVPASGYERWKELQLNFDAREMLGG